MFNEKSYEEVFENGEVKKYQVWQSPKYLESRAKAIEVIQKYEGITEADFWILMNKTKSGKMAYTGLIISHNGCLKINDKATEEDQVKAECFSVDKEGFGGSLVYTYCCPKQKIYEVGEVSKANCSNNYYYAMAFKRCFDRVVLKISKIAYAGIYSEAEAEEFKNQYDDIKPKEKPKEAVEPLREDLIDEASRLGILLSKVATYYRKTTEELTNEELEEAIKMKKENKNK